uniref:Uncharacterized protein n=1 Tax=Alexandrium monilatum TaxID=311494 RepID=A0A7S4SYY6_9DINO
MPGALRAVAPSYAVLAPGSGQGPWLPEHSAKRAWPDSAEDSLDYCRLGLDAFESFWEPCSKRPRRGLLPETEIRQPAHHDEVESSLKRAALSLEDLAKRRRLEAAVVGEAEAATRDGHLELPGEDSTQESGRRVSRRTVQWAVSELDPPAAPEELSSDSDPSSNSLCTDIVACGGVAPHCNSRILGCIRDAFMPCSPDVSGVLRTRWLPDARAGQSPDLPMHLGQESLQSLRIPARRAGKAIEGLPSLVVFHNGCHSVEPMEALFSEVEEPQLPGFIIYDEKRRLAPGLASESWPSPQYSLRECVEEEREEGEEEEDHDLHPMVM